MNISLTNDQILLLKNLVVKPLSKTNSKVYIFGSRVKGSAVEFSDVDLLVKSDICNDSLKKLVSTISEALENSGFQYKVDLVIDSELSNEYRDEVYEHMIPLL